MKKTSQVCIFITLLTLSAFAQENLKPNEYENLSKQLSPSKSVKEFEIIIDKAKDVYKNNKKRFRNNQEELAKRNLAYIFFRKKVFHVLNKKLDKKAIGKKDALKFLKLTRENAKGLDKLFENVIETYEKDLRVENNELATAKFEFANSLQNYQILSTKDYSGWKGSLEKTNKVQTLYLGAYRIWEKTLDTNHELVFTTGFHLANSYMRSADFEKALPLYERYISGVTEKFGDKSKNLLPALEVSAAVWNLIGRNDEVGKIEDRLTKITRKKSDLGEAFLTITLRAKSFRYKGINKNSGAIIGSSPVGVIREGRTGQARNSINTPIDSRLSSPVYTNMIGGGGGTFIISSGIKTHVTVNTEGKVTSVKAETEDLKLKAKIEKAVKKWEFEPFIYEGKNIEMKGLVYYQVLKSKKLKF